MYRIALGNCQVILSTSTVHRSPIYQEDLKLYQKPEKWSHSPSYQHVYYLQNYHRF